MSVPHPCDVFSIGTIAGQLQTPVRLLAGIAEALDIAPTLRINGIPHFSAVDCDRIAEELRRRDTLSADPTANRANGLM